MIGGEGVFNNCDSSKFEKFIWNSDGRRIFLPVEFKFSLNRLHILEDDNVIFEQIKSMKIRQCIKYSGTHLLIGDQN